MTQAADKLKNGAPAKAAPPAAAFAVPGLLFDNRTPFAAMQFDAVDQHGGAFHVFVAKIGYALGPCGPGGLATLHELDTPAQLNTEDRHEGGDTAASVLEESDFAPYKPACDVIVNALAYAPGGKPARQFDVALSVSRPAPATAGQASRRLAIIDKTLTVCGTRWFKKKGALRRLLHWPVRILTLGLARPNPWRLTSPTPLAQLPLRYEYAAGGECRVDHGERAAKRVPKKHRLADAPAPGTPPPTIATAVAHEACQSNPLGRGFSRRWFLNATRAKRLPAPQISAAALPISARQLWRGACGAELPAPAGMGPVGRAWNPRRALIGNIEDKARWAADDIPRLPAEFDFAYWNGAPLDQQCPYPTGNERIALVNLCRAGEPAAHGGSNGNTLLRIDLPQQAMFVLAVDHEKKLTVLPLVIDTITVDPEARRFDLVWRACLPADGSNTEARLMHIKEPAQLARLEQLVQHQWPEAPAAAAPNGK